MPGKGTWALVAAGVAAVVTVTAATVVLVDKASPPTTVKTITGTKADAPGVAWSLDAAKSLGRPFGEFTDPRGGASYRSGDPGFVLAGDTLVTIAGSPTDNYVLDDAVMLGIDPETGSVRWKVPAADVEECSGTPLGNKIYCYATGKGGGSDIVTYDIESGTTARRSIDQLVFGITTTSDTLYIAEGNPEDDDVRVHSGTFADVSANWTRGFDIGATWDGVYEDKVLTVIDGVGLVRTGGELAQFDAGSGAERWKSNDYCLNNASLGPGGVVVQSNTNCTSSTTVTGQQLRDPAGKVLATTKSPAVQRPSAESGSGVDKPVLLGDAAYDRSTGDRLWSNRDLVTGDGSLGSVTAIVGDVVYLRVGDRGQTGVNLRTGKQLWHNGAEGRFTPLAANDTQIIGDDGTTLTAFDVGTGRTLWTAPFIAIDPDPETFRAGGAAVRYSDQWIYSSDRRMIGLAPR